MALDINAQFDLHTRALGLANQRLELLADNVANADTPNYKARDIDFRAAMQNAQGGEEMLAPCGEHGAQSIPSSAASRRCRSRPPAMTTSVCHTLLPHRVAAKSRRTRDQTTAHTIEFPSGLRDHDPESRSAATSGCVGERLGTSASGEPQSLSHQALGRISKEHSGLARKLL